MLNLLNTYLNADFKLVSIFKNKVFVFEKNEKFHLTQVIKPSDDKNKNFIGINSLKDATSIFQEALAIYKNVKSLDYVISNQVTPQSRTKFYEHNKEVGLSITINFCGLNKLKTKI